MSLQLCQFMYERELNLFAHFCVDKCGRGYPVWGKVTLCVRTRVWPLNNESPPPVPDPFSVQLAVIKAPHVPEEQSS